MNKDLSNAEHKAAMQKQQDEVRSKVASARIRRGVIIYLYGNGKGKSSSAFGTLARSLGHGKKGAVIQFIKGKWKTGEVNFFKGMPNLDYHVMGTGFTWDTQDREKDIEAAEQVWEKAIPILKDSSVDIILFDEITYMFKYNYLSVEKVAEALVARPEKQNVIITGRDAIPELIEIADTISEVKEIRHAFKQGVKAQKGIEF
ncbi:MAG: cob(I)yrinic acid a,c-diamide adenosyltransferase [Gammaproteobacteria bacterium]|nr:cob(I)yrinic acid a,c-diamide adenosyltransferase [Gammaproteobacteria bacterium]